MSATLSKRSSPQKKNKRQAAADEETKIDAHPHLGPNRSDARNGAPPSPLRPLIHPPSQDGFVFAFMERWWIWSSCAPEIFLGIMGFVILLVGIITTRDDGGGIDDRLLRLDPRNVRSLAPILPNRRPRVYHFSDRRFRPSAGRYVEALTLVSLGNDELFDKDDHSKPAATPPFRLNANHLLDGGEGGTSECSPAAKWQTKSYPTCNAFHELDFSLHLLADSLNYLGHGQYRDVWTLLYPHSPDSGDSNDGNDSKLILKTLKSKQDFTPEYYENHRIDALAFERLTASPYVLDIYGHCGHSVLNELAKDDIYGYFRTAEKEGKNVTSLDKLEASRDIAMGIAATHDIEGGEVGGGALLVHGDLAPSNLVLSFSGHPKIKMNDYNNGILLGYNKKMERRCIYKRHNNCSPFRAPEECLDGRDRKNYLKAKARNETYAIERYLKPQSEKTDVYHLGNLIFFILTGCSPYKCGPKPRVKKYKYHDERAEHILKGVLPQVEDSDDAAVSAMKWAIDQCRKFEMSDRPSAREVADRLDDAWKSLKKTNGH